MARVHAGDLRHGPRDVGVDGKHAAKADGAEEDGEQDLAVFQRAELGEHIRFRHARHVREEEKEQDHREPRNGHDQKVRRMPAQSLA